MGEDSVEPTADAVEAAAAAAAARHAAALAALDEAIAALERLRETADWFNSSQAMGVAVEVVALKGMRAMAASTLYPSCAPERTQRL